MTISTMRWIFFQTKKMNSIFFDSHCDDEGNVDASSGKTSSSSSSSRQS